MAGLRVVFVLKESISLLVVVDSVAPVLSRLIEEEVGSFCCCCCFLAARCFLAWEKPVLRSLRTRNHIYSFGWFFVVGRECGMRCGIEMLRC